MLYMFAERYQQLKGHFLKGERQACRQKNTNSNTNITGQSYL
jgi:hypothetical protein